MSEAKIINGVKVSQLFETIDVIKQKPEIAKFKFRATNKWVNGGHNTTMIKDFYGAGQEDTTRLKTFVMEADEPAVLLGEDAGANPTEYLLAALAGCLTTSMVYHAAAQGIKIESIESSYEGDLDLQGFLGLSDKIRNGYEGIRVTFKIKADAPEETLQELIEIAQQRSPVFDIVTNPVPVTVQLAKTETMSKRKTAA